ncbi:PREDICTED: MRG/MORF4L-binding protein-like, partial [Gekko japonicus]|uniref:MRG/MORF4L-binding protein-like n=1 Tax=Gekko japonicus TaxID=146911 RepID=A0ABM1KI28_GEKJA
MMGEGEASVGVADPKPPCPVVGPLSMSAPPEPALQAAAEEVTTPTTPTVASAAAVALAAAAAITTAATAPPPLPPPPPLPVPPVPVVWSPEVEVCLFHAMLGHKPVGVNRHFHMICIRDKFSQNIGRQISSKVIWDHLSTMYDMQAL